jgi:hypothetical protein
MLNQCFIDETVCPMHGEQKTSTIWKPWLKFVHSCTDGSEVPVQLSIIERMQFHLHHLCLLYHPSSQSKERCEPQPCRVCIRLREKLITGTQASLRQKDQTIGQLLQYLQTSLTKLAEEPFNPGIYTL